MGKTGKKDEKELEKDGQQVVKVEEKKEKKKKKKKTHAHEREVEDKPYRVR